MASGARKKEDMTRTGKDVSEVREKLKRSSKRCFECGKDKSSRCTGCFLALYCSPACQKNGWTRHKDECKETRAKYRKAKLEKVNFLLKYSSYRPPDPAYSGIIPSGQFAVKVQVDETRPPGKHVPLMVYNETRNLYGTLFMEGHEELYDQLSKKIRESGFQGYKGFFSAICKRVPTEVEGFTLEINPDQMLPVETW